MVHVIVRSGDGPVLAPGEALAAVLGELGAAAAAPFAALGAAVRARLATGKAGD